MMAVIYSNFAPPLMSSRSRNTANKACQEQLLAIVEGG